MVWSAKPTSSTSRGVSSCSSLGWPAGWPDMYLGAKSGWHNAWLSEWCNLTPAMQCHAVNTANVTLLPCNQCHKRAQGRSSHGRTP